MIFSPFSSRRDLASLALIKALLLLAITMALACTGCTQQEAPQTRQAERPVPVTMVQAVQETLPFRLHAVGNVEPVSAVDVKSQVGGLIVEQFVVDGQDVLEGDRLFRIDPRPFELSIRESQAKLERDRALLNKAKDDLRRYTALQQKDVVSVEKYEDTFAQLKTLEGTIALNEAILERSRLDLEYADIRASISGRVGSVLLHKGNVVKANDDRTLCVINQIRPIYVSFSLPERYLVEVLSRQREHPLRVEVHLGLDTPGAAPVVLHGEVAAVDNAVDTTTGTIRLSALFANEEGLLWPGQFVRVTLILRILENVVLVPTQAVLDGLHGPYLYVIGEGNRVEARNVTTGTIIDGRSMLEQGVAAGERVVLDGHLRLAPGVLVEIKPLSATAPDKGSEARVSSTPGETLQ